MFAALCVASTVIAALLALVVVLFLVEVLLSLISSHGAEKAIPDTSTIRSVILVPAHNEGQNIIPTIKNIQSQLAKSDRIIVVADNCDDSTADVARDAGAEVTVRICPEKRGKGFALDWGLQHLTAPFPDVVIIVDADCCLEPLSLQRLKNASYSLGRPVQALYIMEPDPQSEADHSVGLFAWMVKNYVRPMGLKMVGLPCQLMGTGMAFPHDLLTQVNVATGHLAEDQYIGIACSQKGTAPYFLPSAVVRSRLERAPDASSTQRQRWEHGHLKIILEDAVPNIVRAVLTGNGSLLALSLDLLIPPLTFLSLILLLSLVLSLCIWWITGYSAALAINGMALALLAVATFFAWCKAGRTVLPPKKLALLPIYLVKKSILYAVLLTKGFEKRWIRTER